MGTAEAAEVIKSGVYRIDLGGGRYYVGSACDLKRREVVHRSYLRCAGHHNRAAQRAFNKYGVFVFTVLGRYPVDEILLQEQILLDAHFADPKCANFAPTAGNCLGRKCSDATRAKISTANKGKKRSREHCAAISAAHTGKKLSPEHRAAQTAGRTGMKYSPSHCAAISASQVGRKHTAASRAKMSLAHAGKSRKPHTAQTRAKISAAATGRKHSHETRAKIRAAWAHWREVRAATAAA